MITLTERYIEISHLIDFWTDRLEESIASKQFLLDLQDNLKIQMNEQNIIDIQEKLVFLKNELDRINS
jgi:hypothetical protein